VERAAEESRLGSATGFLTGNELAPIEKAMAPVRDLVEPPEKEATFSIAEYRERLAALNSVISRCAKGKLDEVPDDIDETAELVQDFAASYSAPSVAAGLENLLLLPLHGAEGIITLSIGSGKAGEAADAWADQVLAPYQKAIRGKYPFRANADEAAIPAAVAAFFKSGGPLDAFSNVLHEKDVEPGHGTSAAFRAASDIRGFMGADQGILTSAFRATLSPPQSLGVDGDANLKKIDLIELVVNGQKIAVRSSTQSKTVRWSSDDADPTSYLSLRQSTQNQELGKMDGGTSSWSWFRLVDRAEVERAGDAWKLTWEFADLGVSVVCEITMNQGSDFPFASRSAFRTFSLPSGYAN